MKVTFVAGCKTITNYEEEMGVISRCFLANALSCFSLSLSLSLSFSLSLLLSSPIQKASIYLKNENVCPYICYRQECGIEKQFPFDMLLADSALTVKDNI